MTASARSPYDALQSLGLSLPEMAPPVARFAPYVRANDLIFVSGHIAKREGRPWVGQLGIGMTTSDGQAAARQVALDLIGTLHVAAGDLRAIRQIVKLTVLVNSSSAFTDHHLVANGASELFLSVFGDRGAHSRSAFGVAQVPFGSCLEIELVAAIG